MPSPQQLANVKSTTDSIEAIKPKEVVFLINPHAGTNPPEVLTSILDAHQPPIAYYLTESKEAVPTFFATAAKSARLVVICGGDGTVNSILPYAVDSALTFAVYPNGSGDGFAKEMGYSRDVDAILAAAQRGQTRCIDVMRADQHYAGNVVGVGFDSYVAREFAKRDQRGFKAYILESAKAYQAFDPIEAMVTIDGKEISGEFSMITVANTPQFGNNARIAPMADASDGLLDIVLVRPMPFLNALRFLVEVFAGKEDGSRYVSYHRGKEVRVSTSSSHCQIDGETYPFLEKELLIAIAGEARWLTM